MERIQRAKLAKPSQAEPSRSTQSCIVSQPASHQSQRSTSIIQYHKRGGQTAHKGSRRTQRQPSGPTLDSVAATPMGLMLMGPIES